MREISVPSGTIVKISEAPWADAMALKNAIGLELAKGNIDISLDFQKDMDVGQLIKLVALLDSSQNVQNALMKCLARCTYDGQAINSATFEPVGARQDYYDIVVECLKENLSPFFKSLLSRLQPFMQSSKTPAEAPKSELKTK